MASNPGGGGRSTPALRRVAAILALAVAVAACAVPPRHRPTPSPLPEPPPRERTAGAVQQERLIRGSPGEYYYRVAETVLPRAAAEIEYLVVLRRADRITASDFYHLHLRYRESAGPRTLDELLKPEAYPLHYHTLERPHELRQAWAREFLNLLEHAEPREPDAAASTEKVDRRMRRWARSRLLEAEDRRVQHRPAADPAERPAELSADEVEAFAAHWHTLLSRHGYSVPVSRLADELRFVDGPRGAGYSAAVQQLFRNRSIISRKTEQEVSFRFTETRFERNEWHPVTIYFGRIPSKVRPETPDDPTGSPPGLSMERTPGPSARIYMLTDHPLTHGDRADERHRGSWMEHADWVCRDVALHALAASGIEPEHVFGSRSLAERAVAVGIVENTVFLVAPSLGELRFREPEPGWALRYR